MWELVPDPPMCLHLEHEGTAHGVGVLRRALQRWLEGTVDDEDVVDDLTLAASEALENAADHAFSGRPGPGTMTVPARAEGVGPHSTVVVTVTDDGSWRTADADRGHRGRGLSMIAQLTDDHSVTSTPGGTTVSLRRRAPVSGERGSPRAVEGHRSS